MSNKSKRSEECVLRAGAHGREGAVSSAPDAVPSNFQLSEQYFFLTADSAGDIL